jgi:hypothetical protein
MSLQPGTKLGPYEVVAPIGAGGSASVRHHLPRELRRDQWVVPLTGDKKPFPFLNTAAIEANAQISPDGKWIAYSSNETANAFRIYIRPFPDGPAKFQVSTDGGYFPRWRHDGKELYYLTDAGGGGTATNNGAGGGNVMAVEIRVAGSSIQPGVPRTLFPSGYFNTTHGNTGLQAFGYHAYAVSADGQRFLIPQANATGNTNTLADDIAAAAGRGGAVPGGAAGNSVTVVLNWASALNGKNDRTH